VTKFYRMEHLSDLRLPIIALTADGTSETERLCRDAGLDAVLTKPVEATQLLAAIDETYARVTPYGAPAANYGASYAPSPAPSYAPTYAPSYAPPAPLMNSFPAAPPPPPSPAPSPVVTPISSHPRFLAENAGGVVVDEAIIDALKALGGGNDFLAEVIEAFRGDAHRLFEHLRTAVAETDLRAFKDLTHSLKSGGANVGAVRFCQTLTALKDITPRDLAQNGPSYLEKLLTEFAKLEIAFDRLQKDSRRR